MNSWEIGSVNAGLPVASVTFLKILEKSLIFDNNTSEASIRVLYKFLVNNANIDLEMEEHMGIFLISIWKGTWVIFLI